MCRSATPEKDRVNCGRCSKCINPTDGWESGWPLYGTITLGFASQAFAYLCGGHNIATGAQFKWWDEGHPAMSKNGAQLVEFKWDSESRWRLCYDCQKELLQTVGKFFGIDKRAREIERELLTSEAPKI